MRRLLGTISREDFERRQMIVPHTCNCSHCGIGRNGRTIGLPLGGIQEQDIGKQVWEINGIIQVENNSQRDLRLAQAERELCRGLDRGRTGRL
jgi:hypothetical protein